jgi:hypothetical protein
LENHDEERDLGPPLPSSPQEKSHVKEEDEEALVPVDKSYVSVKEEEPLIPVDKSYLPEEKPSVAPVEKLPVRAPSPPKKLSGPSPKKSPARVPPAKPIAPVYPVKKTPVHNHPPKKPPTPNSSYKKPPTPGPSTNKQREQYRGQGAPKDNQSKQQPKVEFNPHAKVFVPSTPGNSSQSNYAPPKSNGYSVSVPVHGGPPMMQPNQQQQRFPTSMPQQTIPQLMPQYPFHPQVYGAQYMMPGELFLKWSF